MALLLPPMSAIPHIKHHMTSAHGHSVPSNLSHSPANAVTQSGDKRPKLSLQTTSLNSTYGSLTRGIAPNTTQTTYTPTTANTLSNTWDLSIRPSPISRTESPRPLHQARPPNGQQPYIYSLPFGVKPILKNSPLPPRPASVSASPRDSRRKVFFPQPKRVSFKQDLEEEIETKQYIAKHSDLTSSEEEVSDEEAQVEPTTLSNTEDPPSAYHTSPPPNRKRKVRRDSGIFVDTKTEIPTSTITTTDNTDDTTAIKPPSSCKRRKWQSSPTSFGGPLEKEGMALRRNSTSSTSENTTSTPDPSSESSIFPNEDPINEKEDCEVSEGPGEEGRRTSSPLPVSHGTPDPKDFGSTPESSDETERHASTDKVDYEKGES